MMLACLLPSLRIHIGSKSKIIFKPFLEDDSKGRCPDNGRCPYFLSPFTNLMKAAPEDLQARSLEQKPLDWKDVKGIRKGFREGQVHWARVWALAVWADLNRMGRRI